MRVVLLSPCSGGYVLRVGEPPSLGASGCGHGLCVRPRIVPLARAIRRGPSLFRFPVRSLEVCGISPGSLLGPRLSDVVRAETRGRVRPGAGDRYWADPRWGHVQAVRGLAIVGRAALRARLDSSHPRLGPWPRVFRGSPESARAQPARHRQLFPLFDSCPASPGRERPLRTLSPGRVRERPRSRGAGGPAPRRASAEPSRPGARSPEDGSPSPARGGRRAELAFLRERDASVASLVPRRGLAGLLTGESPSALGHADGRLSLRTPPSRRRIVIVFQGLVGRDCFGPSFAIHAPGEVEGPPFSGGHASWRGP